MYAKGRRFQSKLEKSCKKIEVRKLRFYKGDKRLFFKTCAAFIDNSFIPISLFYQENFWLLLRTRSLRVRLSQRTGIKVEKSFEILLIFALEMRHLYEERLFIQYAITFHYDFTKYRV